MIQRSWINLKLNGILRLVVVSGTREHTELRQHLGGQAVLREHALHGLLDDEFRLLGADIGELAVLFAADIAGERHVLSVLFLLTGEDDLAGVDDNDEITGIDVGRVSGLVTAAEDIGGFNGETAQHLAFGIDQIPLGLHCLFLGQIGFHLRKGAKGKDSVLPCQHPTFHILKPTRNRPNCTLFDPSRVLSTCRNHVLPSASKPGLFSRQMSPHCTHMRSPPSFLPFAAGILGLTGVALGAFGAHSLKNTLEATGGLENWKTAVFYQLVHAVALLALASRTEPVGRVIGRWWVIGVVLFSGSLYALALGVPAKFIWPVTPLGGLALLLGAADVGRVPSRPIMTIPPPLRAALTALHAAGGRPRLVGGSVRDWLMGITPKDFDVEVYGMDYERMGRALAPFGPTDLVGRSFGVLKVRIERAEYDFSLPRRESKTGAGHRGFAVTPDPDLTEAEAAARRDFTVNAIAYDPLEER